MGSTKTSLNPDVIDWLGPENSALLNPRWTAAEADVLFEVARTVGERRGLQGHLWIATSGSTSESAGYIKLVALSKQAFLASAKSVNQHLGATPSDIWLQVLPRFHVGGLGVEVRAMLSGSKVVSDFEKWNPLRIHKLMAENKITIAAMVPAQVFDLVRAELRSPPGLRAVIVGGGALNESLYHSARLLGWPALPSYGMTETCSQIATASLATLKSDKTPLAQRLSHIEWRTTPEGLLQVRGPSLLTCYGQLQKDGQIRDWDPKDSGWLETEDFVTLENDTIRFSGRKSDFIKIGGEGSSMGRLREIFDRVVATLDAGVSQQVLLADAPSARLGCEIHLITTIENRNDFISQLQENFNREVLPFERIREVKYVSSIPRSSLGKVLWEQLKRDLYGH